LEIIPEKGFDFIKIDSHILEYNWIKKNSSPQTTLIFLHEGLGCVALWRNFPEQLAKASGCNAFVYSRAGYGASSPVSLPRSVDFMHKEANILETLIKQCAIDDFILVGHSDGASIALLYAGAENVKKPRAVILEAPHLFVEDCCLDAIREITETYDTTDFKDRLKRHHGENTENAFRGWSGIWLNPEFREWNIVEVLPSITVPMLVIQGNDDQYGTLLQVEAVKNGAGGPVEVVLMPECGHSPHREQAELTLNAMSAFISSIQLRDNVTGKTPR